MLVVSHRGCEMTELMARLCEVFLILLIDYIKKINLNSCESNMTLLCFPCFYDLISLSQI